MPHASHVGPTGCSASSGASSVDAALPDAPIFGGSTRYFLAQSSHKWTSSYRSSPSTSVMCKVAVFGHRWHFKLIADPFALRPTRRDPTSWIRCEVHSNTAGGCCHCRPLSASSKFQVPSFKLKTKDRTCLQTWNLKL